MYNNEIIKNLIKNRENTYLDIVKKLKIPHYQNKDFSIFLNQMVEKKEIFKTSKGNFIYYEPIKKVSGIIKINPKGFGFLTIDENTSYFVPKFHLNYALNNDEVEANIYEDLIKENEYYAVITKIIARNNLELIGYVKQNESFLDFVPYDSKIKGKFRWKNLKENSIKNNDVVKIKIEKNEKDYIYISLIKTIGKLDEAFIDIQMSIENANVPYVFEDKTIEESLLIPDSIKDENIDNRVDLRKEIIVTIDGDDTKDFDDAISVKQLKNGNFVLGVHIADVSHYVKPNSAIDQEAAIRGTSIYLADRVIPMLPEKLSNGICSLNPNVDRFTITMEAEIDQNGKNVNVNFFPSIINSYKRLTYKEVNEFYKGNKNFDSNIENLLINAKKLANIIRKFKIQEGYIDFEIEESKIILDENGKTIDIKIRERGESEILIEDFMVRANENIAEFMSKLKLPFIYRIHDVPENERIIELNNVLKLLKINVNVPLSENPIDFAKAINKIKEINFDDFIKIMMLRTMQKAIYSTNNIGHFGLASKHYTHFTSPIRRYPDLLVHRLLRTFIFEKQIDKKEEFIKILDDFAQSSSLAEQNAVSLERKVADIKKAEFYENKIGQSFEGQITSIKKFGFFVEFNNKTDVMVHVSNLEGEDYQIDELGLILSNKKFSYKVGDRVEVTIISTLKNEGKIDAVLNKDYELYKTKTSK